MPRLPAPPRQRACVPERLECTASSRQLDDRRQLAAGMQAAEAEITEYSAAPSQRNYAMQATASFGTLHSSSQGIIFDPFRFQGVAHDACVTACHAHDAGVTCWGASLSFSGKHFNEPRRPRGWKEAQAMKQQAEGTRVTRILREETMASIVDGDQPLFQFAWRQVKERQAANR